MNVFIPSSLISRIAFLPFAFTFKVRYAKEKLSLLGSRANIFGCFVY